MSVPIRNGSPVDGRSSRTAIRREVHMKKQLVLALCGVLMAAAVPATFAGTTTEETTTKTTTFKGVVSEMPDSSTIVLKSDSGMPTRYQFSEKTTFVDADGNVVSRETIRNQPVTIYTAPEGGSTIVSKVVVDRGGGSVRREKTVEERRTE
jgi:hypothetical protein